MRILHISAAHHKSGAGIAALLTHKALLKKGIESKLIFIENIEDLSQENIIAYENNFYRIICRKFSTFIDNILLIFYPNRINELFSVGFWGLKHRKNKYFISSDIIHLHWINHGFINISEIQKWGKPVVWTLRDMWAFTGGCHYSINCSKYQSGCGNCYKLNSNSEFDLSFLMNKYKKKYLNTDKIIWIAVSSWIEKRANESAILKGKPIEVIYSGIDISCFNQIPIEIAREKLNLPLNKKIILIGATNINDKYKGFEYIKNLLNRIEDEILIVSFGNGIINRNLISHEVINMGYIDDSHKLNLLYNSADIFLAPSISEAFGKTFAEAQSSGLPVLCFNETGPKDIIEHRITGYLSDYLSDNDLYIGYNFLCQNKLDRKYISTRATELFDIDNIINNYIRVYKRFINY
jgi:glycosyltransferase involved in cell wall biosynthesis